MVISRYVCYGIFIITLIYQFPKNRCIMHLVLVMIIISFLVPFQDQQVSPFQDQQVFPSQDQQVSQQRSHNCGCTLVSTCLPIPCCKFEVYRMEKCVSCITMGCIVLPCSKKTKMPRKDWGILEMVK